MGYGAMAAGNHEFDFGLDHLRTMQGLAAFPILCSNLAGRNVELPCREFTVLRTGDLSIGLLGLLGRTNFPDTFNREVVRLLELRDPIETARRLTRDLKDRLKADVVLAITHQDDEEDVALLAQVPELDAIIGGHTPGFDGLRTAADAVPVPVVERPGTVFVKTHRQGRTVGRLDLTFERAADREGRVTVVKAQAHNLPVAESLPPHPAVDELIQGYVVRMERLGSTVVGRSLVDLDGENAVVRVRETNLGNLLTDLARLEFGADVALINSGQIRDSIPAGSVDLTRVLRVLPFNSTLVTFTLFGRDLRAALENSVSRLPSADGRFLQVSGLKVTYEAQAPAGSRIRSVMVGERPLDPMARYSVVTDMFLADGGDGYAVFRQAQDRVERQVPLRDLLLKALKAAPLKASIEHRLAVAETSASPLRDATVQ
jgi:2',3'-cyclic-nucleotide 2'-phosphodiesterase (5'-nucleotidase family)